MAVAVGDHRAFGALLAAIDRGWPRKFPSTGRFGDRPVHRQVLQVETDHLVVGGEGGLEQFHAHVALGPVGQSSADHAIRTARAGDALVAAAVDQGGEHVVEHDPVGDPAPVTPPRMRHRELGMIVVIQQRGELDPQGFGQGCWQQGHGPSR
jgi:hypothetical protein